MLSSASSVDGWLVLFTLLLEAAKGREGMNECGEAVYDRFGQFGQWIVVMCMYMSPKGSYLPSMTVERRCV